MARTIPSNFVATIPTLSSWNLGSTGAVHTLQFHEVWSMKKYHALKYHKHYLGQMKLGYDLKAYHANHTNHANHMA